MKAKHNRRYPDLHVGDTVQIYQKNQLYDKGHVSKWTNEAYTVTFKFQSNEVVFLNTNC